MFMREVTAFIVSESTAEKIQSENPALEERQYVVLEANGEKLRLATLQNGIWSIEGDELTQEYERPDPTSYSLAHILFENGASPKWTSTDSSRKSRQHSHSDHPEQIASANDSSKPAWKHRLTTREDVSDITP